MNKEFSLINFLERVSYLENKINILISDTKEKNASRKKFLLQDLINDIINELIPITDSLEMFIKSFNSNQTGELETVLILFRIINNFFKKFNVKQISKEKIKFDPFLHEAISIYNGSEFEKGTIRSVLQPGYIRNNELIRPALVIVNN